MTEALEPSEPTTFPHTKYREKPRDFTRPVVERAG